MRGLMTAGLFVMFAASALLITDGYPENRGGEGYLLYLSHH